VLWQSWCATVRIPSLSPQLWPWLISQPDFLLTKGNVFIPSLYNGTPANKNYYYTRGVNIQAVVAYLIGIALPFPGFCGELGANVSTAAAHIADLGWILSFVMAFIAYYLICQIWPTANMRYVKEHGYGFEQTASEMLIDSSEWGAQNGNVVRDEVYVDKHMS